MTRKIIDWNEAHLLRQTVLYICELLIEHRDAQPLRRSMLSHILETFGKEVVDFAVNTLNTGELDIDKAYDVFKKKNEYPWVKEKK